MSRILTLSHSRHRSGAGPLCGLIGFQAAQDPATDKVGRRGSQELTAFDRAGECSDAVADDRLDGRGDDDARLPRAVAPQVGCIFAQFYDRVSDHQRSMVEGPTLNDLFA